MIDLTKNKHVQSINSMSLPIFNIGNIVNTPFGLGIVVKTPNLEYYGLSIHEPTKLDYTVYFGMPDDKVNTDFINSTTDEELKHEASKWISFQFNESELSNPNRFTPHVFSTEAALKEHKEAVAWDDWRDSLVKK